MNISIKCLGDFNLPKDCLTRLVGQQKMGRPEKPESVDFWLHDIRTNGKSFGRLSVVQCDGDDVLAIVTNADHAPEHATLLEESAYMKWDRKFHVYGRYPIYCTGRCSSISGHHK